MKLHRLLGTTGYTTFGCMWKRGECSTSDGFVCKNEKGENVELQSRITAYWPDGSIKWTAHTADAEKLGKEVTVNIAKNAEKPSGITLEKTDDAYIVNNGKYIITVPFKGDCLVKTVKAGDKTVASNFKPNLVLAEPRTIDGNPAMMDKSFVGRIDSAVLEECGGLLAAFRFEGTHVDKNGTERLRFVIRMKVFYGSEELKFTHTFIYDGEPEKDYLKGLSVSFEIPACGKPYNRHLKFTPDHGVFHESAMTLVSWRPRVPAGLHAAQMRGELLDPKDQAKTDMDKIMEDIPFWDTYDICQDSSCHRGNKPGQVTSTHY